MKLFEKLFKYSKEKKFMSLQGSDIAGALVTMQGRGMIFVKADDINDVTREIWRTFYYDGPEVIPTLRSKVKDVIDKSVIAGSIKLLTITSEEVFDLIIDMAF